jgi:pre-rRNA-processing protein TSR2
MDSVPENDAVTTGPTITPEVAMMEFRAGVTAVLRSWSALKTSVEAGWGGNVGQEKAEELRKHIFSVYDGSKPALKCMPPEELEDALSDYMENEFSLLLEDQSERQVADAIWHMYDQCGRGNVTLARQLVAVAASIEKTQSTEKIVVQVEGEMDEDDDSDVGNATTVSMGEVATTPLSSAELYASGDLFAGATQVKKAPVNAPPARQLGETHAPPPPRVETDDDGFAPVVSRKGKRGK